ncbi:MAG: hypothetical protein RLZZ362_1043 [Actinomycetota bacterium]|jgi:hypothetical protein
MLATADTSDMAIFTIVVILRLVVPLFIPRFPLPAIIAALVLDAVDQTIFQQYTNINTSETGFYQSYDKALDIYYLTIAYTATMRNWGGGDLFRVGRFLWYYRLVGVVLFESTDAQYRWLLLVFPNTFEYFFIAIESYKLRRNPLKLVHKQVIAIAAFIWIVIKLPQEWWIHVAKLDFTNAMKEQVFGVDRDDGWGTALTNRPLVTIGLIVAIGAALWAIRWGTTKLPAPDWERTVDADVQAQHLGWDPPAKQATPLAVFGAPFIEKVFLIGFVLVIFSSILPSVEASAVQVIIAVAVLIALNTMLSELLAKHEVSWRSTGVQFAVMAVANLAMVVIGSLLTRGRGGASLNFGNTVFMVGLLTLIVVLFDRYRDMGLHRRGATALPSPAAP